MMSTKTLSGKKMLVTGGAGFIGSHVCESLLDAGALVAAIDDMSAGRKPGVDLLRNQYTSYRPHSSGGCRQTELGHTRIEQQHRNPLTRLALRVTPHLFSQPHESRIR